MNQYKMKPFVGKPIIEVTVPGSKSITNRALLLAALSEGKSVLKGVLFSDDSRVFMEALKTLGYEIDVNEKEAKVTIVGHGTQIPKQTADVYGRKCRNGGTFFDGNACVVRRALSCDIVKADAGRGRCVRYWKHWSSLVRSFNFLKMNIVFHLKFLDERKAAKKRRYR